MDAIGQQDHGRFAVRVDPERSTCPSGMAEAGTRREPFAAIAGVRRPHVPAVGAFAELPPPRGMVCGVVNRFTVAALSMRLPFQTPPLRSIWA